MHSGEQANSEDTAAALNMTEVGINRGATVEPSSGGIKSSTGVMGTPDWDIEQLEVILETVSAWQLVVAGPGAGKSAVACQRVAYLVDEGIPPSRILLVSFTRTAVAELRDRIVTYAASAQQARDVRILTIDSYAWQLRTGFEDDPIQTAWEEGSFDLSIEKTVALFKSKSPELLDFISRLEHLVVDEAQDVVGLRAELLVEMLQALPGSCGVTILADPAQAIYGFTTDGNDEQTAGSTLVEVLAEASPRPLIARTLLNNHRAENGALSALFLKTRKELELSQGSSEQVSRIQRTIRETSGKDIDVTDYKDLAEFLTDTESESMLVLFRRRADVLFASSFCSEAGVVHRLRMSDLAPVMRPWLGWLFGDTTKAILDRDEFDQLWDRRASIAPAPFAGEQRETCWETLHRLAAGLHPRTLDLMQLRRVAARSRPPVELCYPEVGVRGPILGTIHASKGREADTVVLVMPPQSDRSESMEGLDTAAVFEEARVYYVGATRARRLLVTAGRSGVRVGYLDSKRVYRRYGGLKVQMEVGRGGDVDKSAHLAWSSRASVQSTLAALVGETVPVRVRAQPEHSYAPRVVCEQRGADGVCREIELAQLAASFRADLGKLWGLLDTEGRLRPAAVIPHLYLVAVGSVGLSEEERNAVGPPFNQSALGLCPVLKGFPTIRFEYRRKRVQ